MTSRSVKYIFFKPHFLKGDWVYYSGFYVGSDVPAGRKLFTLVFKKANKVAVSEIFSRLF